tara:strand:+ start:64 stop:780 length:717 start_codon:yes stop_codon:yes gene_type:complete
MANYEIGLTASEIEVALQKAHSPTTSITNIATSDPSLVTSGAVKSAIDNISVGSTLTVDSFATTALETSTDGLTNTDTAIPTSAAVSSAITAGRTKIATMTGNSPNSYSGSGYRQGSYYLGNSEAVMGLSSTYNGDNLVTVSGGVITPTSAGVYQVIVTGEFAEEDGDNADYWNVLLQKNNSTVQTTRVNETGSAYTSVYMAFVLAATPSDTFRCYLQRVSAPSYLYFKNVTMTVIKF